MDIRKIVQALAYFASKQPDQILDNMKAYKLLWLADRFQLRHSGRFLSGDRYYAMPYGPVPSDAKNILECKATKLEGNSEYVSEFLELGGKVFTAKKSPDLKVFSSSDRDVLEQVDAIFGNRSATELSEMSHNFPEWKAYEVKIKDKSCHSSYPIDINLFFEDSDADECGFFDDDKEALGLAKELYFENNHC